MSIRLIKKMRLQQIFIANLKKFRKQQGLSQMKLANKCDSTSNYIGQIEMGRRIPSFEKIEQFAAALKISPSMLFAEPENKDTKEKKDNTRDYLQKMPINVKKELQSRLFTQIKTNIMNSLDGNNY